MSLVIAILNLYMYIRFIVTLLIALSMSSPQVIHAENVNWSEPLPGWDTSKFVATGGSSNSRAFDAYNRGGKGHTGADIGEKTGTPILSVFGGKVVLSKFVTGYGNTIVIKAADGSSFLYAHAQTNLVSVGQTVTAGQTIALVGYSGNASSNFPHVHLQYHPSANKAALLGYNKSRLLVQMKQPPTDAAGDPIALLASLEGGTVLPIPIDPNAPIPEKNEEEIGLPTSEEYYSFIDGNGYDDFDVPLNNSTPSPNNSNSCDLRSLLQERNETQTTSTPTVTSTPNTQANYTSGESDSENTPSYGTSGILNKVMDGLMSTLNDALAGTLSKALGGVIENVAPQLTDLTNPSNGSGNCGAGKPNNYIRMWSCLQAGSTGIDPFINTLKTVAGQIVKDAITNLIGKLSPALSGPLNTLSGIASRTGGSLGDFMGAIGGGSQNNSTQSTGNPLADTNFTQTATNSDTSYKKVTPPDLSATALKTESTITNEYRFRGSINKKNESNTAVFTTEELSQFAGCSIQNKLSLDLDCNGSVDATKDFGIPYQSIMPRADGTEVLLSEYMEVPKLGLHCFAFTIDMNDDIEESNENNNMSAWRPFITGFGQDITESATDATLPIFTLEAAGYTSEGTLSSNWTSNALSISDDEELAIRWNAPAYDSCLPFIAPVSYDFVDNIAPNARNTRTENIDLRERTGTYAVQCSKDGEVRVEVIDVEVR